MTMSLNAIGLLFDIVGVIFLGFAFFGLNIHSKEAAGMRQSTRFQGNELKHCPAETHPR